MFFQDPALRSSSLETFSLLISQGSSIISIAQHPMIGKVLVISMGTSYGLGGLQKRLPRKRTRARERTVMFRTSKEYKERSGLRLVLHRSAFGLEAKRAGTKTYWRAIPGEVVTPHM